MGLSALFMRAEFDKGEKKKMSLCVENKEADQHWLLCSAGKVQPGPLWLTDPRRCPRRGIFSTDISTALGNWHHRRTGGWSQDWSFRHWSKFFHLFNVQENDSIISSLKPTNCPLIGEWINKLRTSIQSDTRIKYGSSKQNNLFQR